MELYAFPDVGVPDYTPIGSPLDRCMVYAIVRTESGFDQAVRDVILADPVSYLSRA